MGGAITFFQVLALLTPFVGLMAVAIWRFSRLEASVHHQARCQKVTIRAVVRLNRELKKLIKSKQGGAGA